MRGRTGVGIANGVNKVKGVRAALVRDITTAVYAKENLNANVIGFGGKITGEHLIFLCIDNFIEAEYKENKKNNDIVQKIMSLENEENIEKTNKKFAEFLGKWDKGEYQD